MQEIISVFSIGVVLSIVLIGIVTRIEGVRQRVMHNFPREWKREVFVYIPVFLTIGIPAYLNNVALIWRFAVVALGALVGKQAVRLLEVRGERSTENFDD